MMKDCLRRFAAGPPGACQDAGWHPRLDRVTEAWRLSGGRTGQSSQIGKDFRAASGVFPDWASRRYPLSPARSCFNTSMRAFEVHLNNKKVCVAGIGDDGVLTAIMDYVCGHGRNDTALSVGGLTSENEHVRWVMRRKLRLGDEVLVKVVEAGPIDKPKARHRREAAQELRDQKRYVREMAKRFGWTISAKSSSPRKPSP